MLIGRNLIVTQKKDQSAQFIMAAVLCAAFDRAKPLTDDETVHPDYDPDDRLSMAEALQSVRNGMVRSTVTVLFLKGREVMLHFRPGSVASSIHVCDEIADGPWPTEVFQDAQRILDRTEHCPGNMH